MTLGEKIASARKEKGMTQEMLAEQLGITRQAVARWETGKALPGTANLFMLRQLLGIPPEEAALEEKTETREPDVQEKAETAGSLTAKQTWVLIAVMAILLWLALQFVGLGAAIGLLILLFISISGLFFIAAGKSGAATAAKAAARRVLYLAAATLLAVLLWCIAFVASANYQSTAMWNVPQDVWQQYPTVAAWMQHCETMGSGVYMQQVDLPASQGAATVYLVCRNGVTNEQAGKITPNPLRLRFWVTYQAGESEPMMLDVLTFQGNKDYQVFFRIGKEQSDCIFTTNESEALAGEVRSLLESRANDK